MAVNADINVPRNAHYFEEWRLLDTDGTGLDLTDQTLEMDCRAIAGSGPVIASATISVVEATEGRFTVDWDGADFDGVSVDTEIVRLAYDLLRTDSTGTPTIDARGHIVLLPGVTGAIS